MSAERGWIGEPGSSMKIFVSSGSPAIESWATILMLLPLPKIPSVGSASAAQTPTGLKSGAS
ncbi:hypothetical protein Mkiyose1665_44690 [Mycobacterium kiyosense]|uniref:Uncharacterized protein n=1 Tax=Mycobacterium kiyosense TaxID=2871094 RepID=A0A9P3QBV7_9MYCO|nr:hypothetical protein IWGMT90018_23620 [Mycobacterium kiyosense]BDE14794.1 hypothetical protein MKCMC460_36540 [Mycobacterium sp. 20KCMC460]GLB84216.1 hypothetical protein SRL2020028_34720 [Mycobacterium kiyosense]GLB91741.1 hypothetical protein SRL2020130_45580 [Mycobacterium kiyosense]GLB96742.1 hypothetical protein SRL2020226_35180 [Mycobacterium kiyosense]